MSNEYLPIWNLISSNCYSTLQLYLNDNLIVAPKLHNASKVWCRYTGIFVNIYQDTSLVPDWMAKEGSKIAYLLQHLYCSWRVKGFYTKLRDEWKKFLFHPLFCSSPTLTSYLIPLVFSHSLRPLVMTCPPSENNFIHFIKYGVQFTLPGVRLNANLNF